MRHHPCSPDVLWPVVPSRVLQRVALAWLLAGGAVWVYWCWASVQPWWLQMAAALGWLMLALWLRLWLRQLTPGVLQWQAGQWFWLPQTALQSQPLLTPQVVLDLQRVLIVRWPLPVRGYYCLWLQRGDDATQWDALRRAVYSSAFLPSERV